MVRILDLMTEPETLIRKLGDVAKPKAFDRECEDDNYDNDELIVDCDGNVSLNFGNEDVEKAFKEHLDVLDYEMYEEDKHGAEV